MPVPPETAAPGDAGGQDQEAAGSSPVLQGRVGPVLRLLCGHVLDLLRQLPERSVHCVVTSPPYLWLRDYGAEPLVWGGEARCAHSWSTAVKRRKVGRNDCGRDIGGRGGNYQAAAPVAQEALFATFCSLCGAWRGSLGLEPSVDLYVEHVVQVFREVWRVLRDDGTLWLNLGDSYVSTGGHTDTACNDRRGAYNIGTRPEHNHREVRGRAAGGLKPKDLVGVPWRVALALQADGWYLRRDIVWAKLNSMPESVTDRPSTAHEYVFLLTKRAKYFYDADAVREPLSEAVQRRPYHQVFGAAREDVGLPGGASPPRRGAQSKAAFIASGIDAPPDTGRNLRSVWSLASSPFPEAHFATYPVEIPTTAIKAGTSERGCCPGCGAPWARERASVTVRDQADAAGLWAVRPKASARGTGVDDRSGLSVSGHGRRAPLTTTTGWRPTCACPLQEPMPCVVLDPFNGAGTSGLAATRLGRSYIGIDLNEEYCDMARRRIEGDAPLLNVVEREGEGDRQAVLFGEVGS